VTERHAWLLWSLGFLAVWVGLYLVKPAGRTQMVRTSLWTMPLGLTEPLFVPEYWNPPSLFDLAQRTGFDLESLIFTFAIGGIGTVLYEAVVPVRHAVMSHAERRYSRHRYHVLALISPVLVFGLLVVGTSWNPIYSGSLAMFAGALASLACRPDLKLKIWIGGGVFLLLYFMFFQLLDLAFPGYVERVWTLSALSGVLVWGVPLEEYLFAVTFGMMWSSVYEHLSWHKVVPVEAAGVTSSRRSMP
jgi:hypothetical protein